MLITRIPGRINHMLHRFTDHEMFKDKKDTTVYILLLFDNS
jgi:hypothetical protein